MADRWADIMCFAETCRQEMPLTLTILKYAVKLQGLPFDDVNTFLECNKSQPDLVKFISKGPKKALDTFLAVLKKEGIHETSD